MSEIFQSIFSIVYLITVITLGIIILKRSKSSVTKLFGIMALVLGLGDAFHLVPRVYGLLTDTLKSVQLAPYVGSGKLITSVTMTVFYLILFRIWQIKFSKQDNKALQFVIWGLAISRIVICLLPQNNWLGINPSYEMGIYRNIPFVIMGAILIFIIYKQAAKEKDKYFRDIATSVLISFAMYIPVVLFATQYPMVGMLMIPKTIAYTWTVVIGYRMIKNEE